MSEALHNSNSKPLGPMQLELLEKMYALLAEAGALADKLDQRLHTRLEGLVATVAQDYAQLTDVVAVVRMPLAQVLEEQLGPGQTEVLIETAGGYRVMLIEENAATDPVAQSHQKVVLLTPTRDITDEVIPAGTVGEFILTVVYGGDWAVEFRDGPAGQGDLTAVINSEGCSLSNLMPLQFNYEIPEGEYEEVEEGAEEAQVEDVGEDKSS